MKPADSIDHQALVAELEQFPEIQTAYGVLREELPRNLVYHNLDHTREVLAEVVRFGLADSLPRRELELLAIAAAFHDTGFSAQGDENEKVSADLAEETLKKMGRFSEDEVAVVRKLILDTTIKFIRGVARQVPSSKLAGYLLDADMSNLGRKDFFEKSELIMRERAVASRDEFLRNLLVMLHEHTWHTPAAKSLRESQKKENLSALKKLIKKKPCKHKEE